ISPAGAREGRRTVGDRHAGGSMRLKRLVLGLVAVATIAVVGWGAIHYSGRTPEIVQTPKPTEPEWFEEVSERAGITFVHFDPATPLHLIPETIGSGVAWIDYDGDGWPDLFCVQAGPLPPAAANPTLTHKLYRNNRDGTFTDVTGAVGLNVNGCGFGCAVGD